MSYAELMGFKQQFGFYDGPNGIPCELTIITIPGATVTIQLFKETYTAVADFEGYARFEVTKPGVWDVICFKDGKTQVGKVTIENKIYKSVALPAKLNNLTWSEISAISKAGIAADNLAIGDTKEIKIGAETYHAQIIDFDHDNVDQSVAINYGRQKAGITFCLQELVRGAKRMHSAATGSVNWNMQEMRMTTLPTIKDTINLDLTDVIVPVIKNYRVTNNATSGTIASCTDELFIPSKEELLGNYTNTIAGEGPRYTLFEDASNLIKKDPDGTIRAWWTRTFYNGQSGNIYINASGAQGGYTSQNNNTDRWYTFCFCI